MASSFVESQIMRPWRYYWTGCPISRESELDRRPLHTNDWIKVAYDLVHMLNETEVWAILMGLVSHRLAVSHIVLQR